MNREIEFERWWAQTGFVCDKIAARYVWNAAWGQLRSEVQSQLMAIAVECFKLHDHTRARFYQDLADEKHSIWGA